MLPCQGTSRRRVYAGVNKDRRRIGALVFAAAALVAAAPACAVDTDAGADASPVAQPPPVEPTELTTLPPCEYPPEVRFPKWVPDDLPLPEGTYAQQRLEPLSGYDRALLVVPVELGELKNFVLEEWPAAGWVLGRGDEEPGEIEDQFSKAPAVGAFKAQSILCDPGYSVMYLIFAAERPDAEVVLTPSPQGSPLQPSPTPS